MKLSRVASLLASYGQHEMAGDVRSIAGRLAFKLEPRLRAKINHSLSQAGLDGNRKFRSVGEGLMAIGEVLGANGLEWDTTLSASLFMHDSGTRNLEIAKTNELDSFSPTSIGNSLVAVSWYKRDMGSYEVLAYLS